MILKALIAIIVTTILNKLNIKILCNYTNTKLISALLYITVILQMILFYKPMGLLTIDFSVIRNLWFLVTLNYIAIVDLYKKEIPNRLITQQLLGIFIIYLVQIFSGQAILIQGITTILITLILTGGSFFIAYLITKGALGAGDVKLMIALGISVSQSLAIATMIIALLLCSFTGIVLVLKKKKSVKDELPYAPFALAGMLLALAI